MLDFLHSEAARWTIGIIVTTVLGIAAIVIPILRTRQRKSLWYTASSYPLVRSGLDERIEILFDGERAPNVYATIINLRYKGAESIVEDDYRTPVTFDFGDARVLAAEVVDAKPDGLQPNLSDEGADNRVVFDPVALNDGDSITARVLLTNKSTPKVSGHIVGVKGRIRHEDQDFRWPADIYFPYLFGTTFALSGFAGIALLVWGRNPISVVLIGAAAIIFFGGFSAVAIWTIVLMIIHARRGRS